MQLSLQLQIGRMRLLHANPEPTMLSVLPIIPSRIPLGYFLPIVLSLFPCHRLLAIPVIFFNFYCVSAVTMRSTIYLVINGYTYSVIKIDTTRNAIYNSC